MFFVHFIEDKKILLTQLLTRTPSVGEDLNIKGRKGKVTDVISIDEKIVHVHVILENVNKNKSLVDNSKKKKR